MERADQRSEPRTGSALGRALRALRGGTLYKAAFEALLRELSPDEADAWMLLAKESRGAPVLLAPAPRAEAGGVPQALFVGDGRSGTVVALGALGYRVTVAERDLERAGFALARGRALTPGRCATVLHGVNTRLPFRDGAFDLVVMEGGLPCAATGYGFEMDELRRLAREAVLVAADNRFAYKRSLGRRGRFERDPRVILRNALVPAMGERSYRGTIAAVRADWPEAHGFALYPSAQEFSHVVALERGGPRLTVRRRERKNRLKLLGMRLGLFPHVTPSFAVIATRRPRAARLRALVDAVYDELRAAEVGTQDGAQRAALAAELDAGRPEVDVLVATRSNHALVHTALPGRGEEVLSGRWTLHIPLQPTKSKMARDHHEWLVELRATHPRVPVPAPLFAGELAGVELTIERRLPGITGADLTGDRVATARMFRETLAAIARLVEPDQSEVTRERFESVIGARAALALAHIHHEGTRRAFMRLVDEGREALVGRPLANALYHADLRAKHVAVRPDGALVGILDWGASERSFVPFVDALHLVLHQRKQETGCSFGAAWGLVRDPGALEVHEAEALARHAADIELDPDARRGIEALYPVFVAGMAERNWDFSRPDWFQRQFQLDG